MQESYQKILAKEALKKINPEGEYSQTKIVADGLIPWICDTRTLKRVIEREALETTFIRGKTIHGDRRSIMGRDIISYLKRFSGL